MGFFASVSNMFNRNKVIDLSGLHYLQDSADRSYIKRMALEDCINFLARSIAQNKISLINDNKAIPSDWLHKLNVKPNKNQTASDFWESVITKLVYDNECLIVLSDDDDLLIADSFEQKKYAVLENRFSQVTVDEFTFKRTFERNEVIYLRYKNKNVRAVVDELFDDYSALFSRLIEVAMRNNQIRGVVNIDAVEMQKIQKINKENAEKRKKSGDDNGSSNEKLINPLQEYINSLYLSFDKKSLAIVPQTSAFKYEEVSNTIGVTSQRIDEMETLRKAMVDVIATAMGIPPNLIHGSVVDLESNKEFYLDFTVAPLIQKIEDELNGSLLDANQYNRGHRFKIFGMNVPNPLKLAEAIDKLVGSGSFSRNEVRIRFGYDAVDGLDEFLVTKNYSNGTENTDLKGGDN
ncbi:phage portal protein [Brochothrix thermosphacta]|uniref:phage portal protein n=1 Tax=Brochothrix thermosphacta TaxID=2756 RepID=UPI000D79E5B7|nr:phage portal protein [Brochothrix thermosphacta]SPN76610.1 putative phage related protein [Brochothrix thermosphacta]